MPNFKEIREQLNKANQVLSDLEEIAILDESLAGQTKANLTKAKEAVVLQKLAELPIENMKDASDSSLRIETLRKFGFTSVASIYHAPESQLERISGISETAAKELKFIADQMFEAVSQSISYGVKIESLTVDDLNLLENVKGLEAIRSKLRGNHTKIRPVANSLKESLTATKPLQSRLRWILAGSEKRDRALNAISNIAFVMGEPTTGVLVSLANDALNYFESSQDKPAVDDFKKRSSDYYAVLEEVSGVKPQIGQRHLNQELIDKIEAENLNTALMSATLRKYQVFGSKFALTQSRVILGDEMGLGKTMQALAAISQRSEDGANRFLIVCPASVLVNWEREITSRTNLQHVKIHGDEQKIALSRWSERGGIGLTTFDTLKQFEFSEEQIVELNVDTIVVDEAHYVKNLGTGRSRTIVKWLDRAPRVLFMTGTPLENRVEEFVNLASLLDRDFAGRLNRAALAAGVDAFRQHVAPMYLRRNSQEVLRELPELIEVVEYCNWNGSDYDYYLASVTSGNFMGMRKAGLKQAREGVMPNKLERLLELVTEAFESGEKVIIFSYFKDVLNLVAASLGDKAIGPITGAVSPQQRQALVDSFTNSPTPVALVGQIQAAGTGLNIQAASVVILCEPQIKPSLEVQAIARAHRMGQVKTVRVHRLVIPEGIDELMMAMLQRKQKEFDDYARESDLANSSEGAKDVTEENIAKIFVLEERRRLSLSGGEPVVIKDDES
jgi:superfamily II DNA or RNA helicase